MGSDRHSLLALEARCYNLILRVGYLICGFIAVKLALGGWLVFDWREIQKVGSGSETGACAISLEILFSSFLNGAPCFCCSFSCFRSSSSLLLPENMVGGMRFIVVQRE